MRLELIESAGGNDPPLFQFHKGAIRTRVQAVGGVPSSDFNSIKVRLELDMKRVLEKS